MTLDNKRRKERKGAPNRKENEESTTACKSSSEAEGERTLFE